MKAAELIVKCLENEGVKHVFGLPGEEIMDVLDALLDSSIQFVLTRHEQGAVGERLDETDISSRVSRLRLELV